MAGRLSLTIDQGAGWERRLRWSVKGGGVIDPTGYTAEMQIRELLESEAVILELSTTNGRIEVGVIDAEIFNGDPHIRLVLTGDETADLPTSGQAKYDLFLTPPGGDPKKLLKGSIYWDGAVTR